MKNNSSQKVTFHKTPTNHKYQEAFQGTIEPVQVQFRYKVALFLVAIMMITLPLIYISMILGIGYGVYYHTTHSGAYLFHGSGGGWIRLGLYLAPIVSGVILIFFMIKPLFMKWKQPNSVKLEPEKEPLLFSFVHEICSRIGASTPRSIDVNCDVNAMASFRRGIMSFWRNDLKLTIGLPLVAGLNLRQFAGVLAHEFGHFAQGTAMRFNYIIQTINSWFARFVYEKDAIDDMLDRWAEGGGFRIGIILSITKLCVWITNHILRFLMFVGAFISSNLLRQMEFDADRYEIRLAGSEAFRTTSIQLRAINAACQNAYQDLYQVLQRK